MAEYEHCFITFAILKSLSQFCERCCQIYCGIKFSLDHGKRFLKFCLFIAGFGNVILKTNMGRVCAVLYAVVGIPLTVLLYVEIGRFLSEQMCELVLRLYALCHPQHEELSGKNATIISTVFIFTTGTISFIFLPSLVIQILEEGWTYLEACYFAFTTIATIGFGDYVAGETN